MKTSEFKEVMALIQGASKGKILMEYHYGKQYSMQETEREGAKALLVSISDSNMLRVEEYTLHDLIPNRWGGKSYSRIAQKPQRHYTLTHKQYRAVVDHFFDMQQSN